ncbi:MAG: hypothetical protein HC899_36865 [Leptolyngbyaceae cyanobacterium SM1_4_3]|nr:hypothetical protein [Leptolyngbyaceae cyanobacterium SM1_4_3]
MLLRRYRKGRLSLPPPPPHLLSALQHHHYPKEWSQSKSPERFGTHHQPPRTSVKDSVRSQLTVKLCGGK